MRDKHNDRDWLGFAVMDVFQDQPRDPGLDNSVGGDPLADGTGIFTPEDCAANGGTWSDPGGSGDQGGQDIPES